MNSRDKSIKSVPSRVSVNFKQQAGRTSYLDAAISELARLRLSQNRLEPDLPQEKDHSGTSRHQLQDSG